jgi:aminopeptidase N
MDLVKHSLTLAQARERAALLHIDSYDIHIDLTRGAETFGSRSSVHFTSSSVGASTFIELQVAELLSLTLNGATLNTTVTSNHIELPDLQSDNVLVVDALVNYVSTGDGLHRFSDPQDDEAYVGAYLGMDYAHHVFACFDQPDLKATVALTVTAPTDWKVLANGKPTSDGSGNWTFATTPRIPTYDFALVAGPWHQVSVEHRGIPFSVTARKSLAEFLAAQAPEILAVSKACFDQYAEMFDEPYAFDSYDSAFVPEFPWGAMESPGCVTFRDEYIFRAAVTNEERNFRAYVIAHEMAHMWFGNLATMRWWDDTWLNESFAEFIGFDVMSRVPGFDDPWPAFAMQTKGWGADADQRPSTHPVAPDPEAVLDAETAMSNFDGISYAKGGAILRELVYWVGRDAFMRGLNDYLTTYQFSNATLTDLLDCVQRASGRDVHSWAARWLQTTGLDTLRGSEVEDTLVVTNEGSRPQHVRVALYDLVDDRLELRRTSEHDLDPLATASAIVSADDEPLPALALINSDDVSYAKVRLDPRSHAVAAANLSQLPTALERAVVWCIFRDLVRDAEVAPQVYLDLVTNHLAHEDHIAVVQDVLRFASTILVDRYVRAELRDAALGQLREACANMVHSRPDDETGIRLAALRVVISTSISDSDIEELRAWLESGQVVPGLAVDADLRWRILLRLAALGRVSAPEIEATAAADTSGLAENGKPRCLAALPDTAQKDAAWERMFDEPDASVYVVEASGEGFWQVEQQDLLAPYAARYFDAALATTQRRGQMLAQSFGLRGFPFHDVNVEILARGTLATEADGVPESLRRVWADQLDDMARALKVRQTW